MNIRFLETFVWLCRLQNFNAVAEKLHTSQPSVSQRISTLEDLFKQRLYVRGGKHFELTAAGRQLLPYAEEIVELSDRMQRNLSVDDDAQQVIRVGIIELITLSFLPRFIDLIRTEQPRAVVDFSSDTSLGLVQGLLSEEELDLIYVWGPVNEAGVRSTHICSFPMAWLASTRHFDCEGRLDVIQLASMPIIMHRPGTSGDKLIREYFTAYGIDHVPTSPPVLALNCSYSLATAMQLVRSGLGIMALPPFLMASEIERGDVAILNVGKALPTIDLTACSRASSSSALAKHLIQLSSQAAIEFAGRVGDTFCHVK